MNILKLATLYSSTEICDKCCFWHGCAIFAVLVNLFRHMWNIPISVTLLMWFIPSFTEINIKPTICLTCKLISSHIGMFSKISIRELFRSAVAEFPIIKISYCREHIAQIDFEKLGLILSDGLGQQIQCCHFWTPGKTRNTQFMVISICFSESDPALL